MDIAIDVITATISLGAAVGTSSTMASDWHLVLSRDGTVMAATDGAPPSWLGTRLDDRADVPEDLKDAGRAILATACHSISPVAASVSLPSIPHSIHLTVIDALPLRRAPTDLRAPLQSNLEVMQRQARAVDVRLSIVVEDNVPAMVSHDAGKIAWAITMLVGNSLRYVHRGSLMMPGGSIVVRAAYNSAGPTITKEVQDDGPGIPADKLRYLFNVGADQPRFGVGLSMVKEVVSAHSGQIEVESETTAFLSGTTIRLTLPG